MAIIVLAIGAIMVIAGAGEIYYGSGFIEIERGWSAFIAGTILLTGGLLTMALGLTLRSLGEVKGVLVRLGGLDVLPPSASHQIAVPVREPPMTLRPAEPAMALEGAGQPVQIEPHFGGGPAAIEAEPMQPLVLREEPTPRPAAVAPPAEPPAAEVSRQAPAMDDWLGREFAALDRAAAPRPAPDEWSGVHASAVETPPPGAAQAAELAVVRHDPAEAEPVYADYVELPHVEAAPPVRAAPEPAAAAPQQAPAQPAVIGRYESDGTSYVMYADGAIEAQSEAGVYRFASMAELKAFIET